MTAYPDEDEVIIQDGLPYRVLENSVQETTKSQKYQLIKLQYPPKEMPLQMPNEVAIEFAINTN